MARSISLRGRLQPCRLPLALLLAEKTPAGGFIAGRIGTEGDEIGNAGRVLRDAGEGAPAQGLGLLPGAEPKISEPAVDAVQSTVIAVALLGIGSSCGSPVRV